MPGQQTGRGTKSSSTSKSSTSGRGSNLTKSARAKGGKASQQGKSAK